MTHDIHYLTLQYLREIKAYHFKNKVEDDQIKGEKRIVVQDICKCFGQFFDFLVKSSNENLKRLIDLRLACDTLINHLKFKLEQDSNLVNDELFKKSVKCLQEEFRLFKSEVYKIEGVIDQRYYENFQNSIKIK